MGLMLPDEIRELRERLDLTQDEICELLQIGAKTYSRWESGRARPSRSMNVLLCGLRDGVITVEYLRSLREGTDWETVRSWRPRPRVSFWEAANGRVSARRGEFRPETGRWLVVCDREEIGERETEAELFSMLCQALREREFPSLLVSTLNEPIVPYRRVSVQHQTLKAFYGSCEPPGAA
jgi:transcriptional regulator with XRE-family HTH domain